MSQGINRNISEVADNHIGIGILEEVARERRSQSNNLDTGTLGSLDTRLGILKDNALIRLEAEFRRCRKVYLGIGLTTSDLIARISCSKSSALRAM